jgi:NADH:ubiquinone oxidoreductase subunit 6 (subunit J)
MDSNVLKKGLIAWVTLGLSLTYFVWVERFDSQTFQTVETGVRIYGDTLFPCFVGAAVILGILLILKMKWASIGWICYISLLFYFGFLKSLNGGWVSFILVVGFAGLIYVVLRKKNHFEVHSSLVLIHVMGTMSGLYMSFHIKDFLNGWIPFQEVIQGLWLLVTQGVFKMW